MSFFGPNGRERQITLKDGDPNIRLYQGDAAYDEMKPYVRQRKGAKKGKDKTSKAKLADGEWHKIQFEHSWGKGLRVLVGKHGEPLVQVMAKANTYNQAQAYGVVRSKTF